MKSIKVCEYSRSRSFHYDLILQDQASGERSQDQWSSGFHNMQTCLLVYTYNRSQVSVYRTIGPLVLYPEWAGCNLPCMVLMELGVKATKGSS